MLKATARASHTSPLWKVTPGRRTKRQVRASVAFQERASLGCSRLSGPRVVRVSNMLIRTFIDTMSPCLCGSSVFGSPGWETRRTLPARSAAAVVPHALRSAGALRAPSSRPPVRRTWRRLGRLRSIVRP